MTIAKGESWGAEVVRPVDLRLATDDAELAQMLTDGSGQPAAATGGDLFRTLGGRPIDRRDELLALPIDLLRIGFGDAETATAVAHVVARRPYHSGGWWRGQVLAVMNAEFIGDFDVAPRGHPNDGRVETLLAAGELSPRQRLAVRRRLRNASHLPHPHITTRSVRRAEWNFERDMDVVVDGRVVGRSRHLSAEVRPDAATIHA